VLAVVAPTVKTTESEGSLIVLTDVCMYVCMYVQSYVYLNVIKVVQMD
jgi:hypothetical protein